MRLWNVGSVAMICWIPGNHARTVGKRKKGKTKGCVGEAWSGRLTFVLCKTDSCTTGLICSSRSVSMVASIGEMR